MRFHTLWEGRWIFLLLLVLAGGLGSWRLWLMLPVLLLLCFTVYFFRDPERVVPADPAAVVAAADGVVMDIAEVDEPEITHTRMKRVGIFLSVFNVHVNRAPVEGTVIFTRESTGQYLDARNPGASRLNAFRVWGFQNERGVFVVRQITGAIARRIVAWSAVGDCLKKGDRFGMIRFGSRTEIYLPLEAQITVQEGDRVEGGVSVIARLP